MPHFGDGVYQHGGDPVGDTVQSTVLFVDNRLSAANDNNTGRRKDRPKTTIQSAIDEAEPGSVIKVMGSGRKTEYTATGFHALTGADLYGVYREQIEIDYWLSGLQLLGYNRPLITGQDGTNQNLTGEIPTVQIGGYGVEGKGPLYTRIKGFHIGGFGDPGGEAGDHTHVASRYGVGIAIGEHRDDLYNDDCYSHTIEDCYFRATNCAAAGQTNDQDVHTWIKGWGNEKIVIRRCHFFQGEHAVAMMPSTNNNQMFWFVVDCNFQYQTVYTLIGGSAPLWCTVKNSVIAPSATGQELYFPGGTQCSIVNCAFPLCASTVNATGGRDSITSASIGTHVGWTVTHGMAQAGPIYEQGA